MQQRVQHRRREPFNPTGLALVTRTKMEPTKENRGSESESEPRWMCPMCKRAFCVVWTAVLAAKRAADNREASIR